MTVSVADNPCMDRGLHRGCFYYVPPITKALAKFRKLSRKGNEAELEAWTNEVTLRHKMKTEACLFGISPGVVLILCVL